jgi:hypothetical protein
LAASSFIETEEEEASGVNCVPAPGSASRIPALAKERVCRSPVSESFAASWAFGTEIQAR